MAFITQAQAEAYLREYYEDNYADDEENRSFEEIVEVLGDQLDMVVPDLVYAYQVYVGEA